MPEEDDDEAVDRHSASTSITSWCFLCSRGCLAGDRSTAAVTLSKTTSWQLELLSLNKSITSISSSVIASLSQLQFPHIQLPLQSLYSVDRA
mmetsp:Transcript_1491/g.2523  ORF Transcript_1491/g.2523 Transcript_1491/m.2523 type:complete len:92 (+) Transcript_1491:1715-1990(+)